MNVSYAIEAEDGDDRVRAIVDATKSAVATPLTLLRDPLPANVGAQPMRDVPGDDRAARMERLAVGERQLLASAARAETRYSLRRHLIVLGGNLLGGAAILTLGDAEDALQSAAIGTAIGEAQIWSQPCARRATCATTALCSRTRAASPGICGRRGGAWSWCSDSERRCKKLHTRTYAMPQRAGRPLTRPVVRNAPTPTLPRFAGEGACAACLNSAQRSACVTT